MAFLCFSVYFFYFLNVIYSQWGFRIYLSQDRYEIKALAKLYFSSYDHEAISVASMYVFLSPMMSVIFRLCVSNITRICYIVYLTQKPRRAMATKTYKYN